MVLWESADAYLRSILGEGREYTVGRASVYCRALFTYTLTPKGTFRVSNQSKQNIFCKYLK